MRSLKETAESFGVSGQALLEYVKKHLDELNNEGEHVFQTRSGKWQFDEVAISRLIKLRKEMKTSPIGSLSSDKIKVEPQRFEEIFAEVISLKEIFLGVREVQNSIIYKLDNLKTEFGSLKTEVSVVKQTQKKIVETVNVLKTEIEDEKIIGDNDNKWEEKIISELDALKQMQEKIIKTVNLLKIEIEDEKVIRDNDNKQEGKIISELEVLKQTQEEIVKKIDVLKNNKTEENFASEDSPVPFFSNIQSVDVQNDMQNLDDFGEWSRKWGDRIFWAIVFVSLMIAGMLVYFGYVNDSSNGDFLNLL